LSLLERKEVGNDILTREDEFKITLAELKLGLDNIMLGDMFGVSAIMISYIKLPRA